MATYPGATFKPLGPQTEPLMRAHNIVCLHTMVGYLTSTDGYFRTGNGAGYQGTESHFGVGGRWGGDAKAGLDGTVWQWQDLLYTADANLDGAWDVISIETADNAASPIAPWTPLQCEAISQLLAWLCSPQAHVDCPSSWLCHREGIPLALIPDTLPGRRGIGYHRQGIDPWRVDGGVRWSPSSGKGCPDPARIAQIPAVIERAIEITQGDDMPLTQEDIDRIANATMLKILGYRITRQDSRFGSDGVPLVQELADIRTAQIGQVANDAAMSATVAKLAETPDVSAADIEAAAKAGAASAIAEGVKVTGTLSVEPT